MKADDNSHYLVYRVLGISLEQGQFIDQYQNAGRFLYKYAGSFLEAAATLCLKFKFPEGKKTRIRNTTGQSPKTFEIDFLNGNDAIEVKWKDATTDGDHKAKEERRVEVIREHGYKPIRVMFYYPQRKQAIEIQKKLKLFYEKLGGEYYGSDEAWEYLKAYSGVDLKNILTQIANERTPENGS
ncbi:MAG: hypothetical protein AUK48_09405 [Oscillatoriales cyanobacterium CG2_30_44_21]|nr:MAG: hypothetical protein AUK48_09405 [Oscillatoriales cyanobacterium CG2_30_44_21]